MTSGEPKGPRYMDDVETWETYWDEIYDEEYRQRSPHELEYAYEDYVAREKDQEREEGR